MGIHYEPIKKESSSSWQSFDSAIANGAAAIAVKILERVDEVDPQKADKIDAICAAIEKTVGSYIRAILNAKNE